jgi:hypothetical protein
MKRDLLKFAQKLAQNARAGVVVERKRVEWLCSSATVKTPEPKMIASKR